MPVLLDIWPFSVPEFKTPYLIHLDSTYPYVREGLAKNKNDSFFDFLFFSDHYAIAHKIQNFLEPYISRTSPDNDGDDYLGDSSSSEDSFEQIGPQDLLPDPQPSAKSPLPDSLSDI